MGGKTAGGGLGGGGGKGGMGGGGGARGPMTAEQADAANQTRRQNIFTTVGGLSDPGAAKRKAQLAAAGGNAPGGLTTPPNPRIRPTGPGGPGAPDPSTDPLAGRDPLTGATLAYGGSVPGGQVPQGAGSVLPEGMAAPALASVFDQQALVGSGRPPLLDDNQRALQDIYDKARADRAKGIITTRIGA